MKQLTIRIILAAMAAFAATGAHAQTLLKAEAPFPFYVSGTRMPPGSYAVRVDRSPDQLVVRNFEAHKLAVSLVNSSSVPDAGVSSGKAKLLFECTDGHCVLFEVWPGAGSSRGMQLPTPKLREDRTMRTQRPSGITMIEAN
jgi:hypothetical protein